MTREQFKGLSQQADAEDGKDQRIAALTAEVERLKVEAVEDDEELERIITYAKRVKADAHNVYEVIDALQTALRETREAADKALVWSMPHKYEGGVCLPDCLRCQLVAVLARHAHLVETEKGETHGTRTPLS